MMKLSLPVLVALVASASSACLHNVVAGDSGKNVGSSSEATSDSSAGFSFSAEYDFEATYLGDAGVQRGRRVVDFDEQNTVVRFILTPRVKFGVLRLGAEWERFSFGMPDRSPLPGRLQSVNAIVGLDTQFSDSILVRFEAQPGFYGSSFGGLRSDDFNVPFVMGGTYIYSPDLQLVFGLGVDVNRDYPVIPGGGVRWKLGRQWVLNAVLPTPQVEFEVTKNITLHAGANLKGNTYRVGDDFGVRRGDSRLNGALLTYTEIRTGAGIDWKITPSVTLSAEGGYVPYREFDFHRTPVRYHEDSGAPYATLSIHGAF
jgi:hypothetical protein